MIILSIDIKLSSQARIILDDYLHLPYLINLTIVEI